MARFRSWIDLERLQTLVEETAWRPTEPAPPTSTWGDAGDGSGARRRPRFFAPDEYFEHEVPPSRRRTEHPSEAPRSSHPPVEHDERRFEVRRRRRWTGVIDDEAPRDGWAEHEADAGHRGEEPRRGSALRVEPPPEPRVPVTRSEGPAPEPRIERRAARLNRSVEPPPEPRVPEARAPVPPPPSFAPGLHYDPPRVGSLEDRLAHLLDWATDVSGSDVAFVADHEGLLLARRHASDVEEAVAAVLEGFLEQLVPFLGDAVEGHVTLRSYGRVFVVTWHETAVGRFFLGIVGASPPPPSVVPELASALAGTVAHVGELARPRSPTPISVTFRPPPPPPPMGFPAPVAEPGSGSIATHPTPIPERFEPPAPPPLPVVAQPIAAPVTEAPVTVAAPVIEAPPIAAAPIEAPPIEAPPIAAPVIAAPVIVAAAPPEPTPPPEVAPSRGRRLAAAIAAAFDPRTVKLRVSLQTGLPVDALGQPDELSEAELDAVSVSLQRILGLDPAKI